MLGRDLPYFLWPSLFCHGLIFKMKKALITGITGQDGAYLAELLLGKGYEVPRRLHSFPIFSFVFGQRNE